jgi:ABC-type transporter Mla maintaining outer membrane lipid asymmetry ATPase subunit MlaF
VDELIEQMRETFFVTSVVITHDMVTAFHIADRVALLARGTIVTSGAPDALLEAADGEIRRFADSSGVDLDKLAAPRKRRSPAEIRALWASAHEDAPEPGSHRYTPWQRLQR